MRNFVRAAHLGLFEWRYVNFTLKITHANLVVA